MALIVMLVALAIVSAICVNLLRMALTERHQARREAQAAQAAWLAESGFDLAAAVLKKDANSAGTTWTVPAKQLDGRHSATVTVKIASVEKNPKRREVTVVAEYQITSQQPVRSRGVRFIDL